MRFLFRNNEPGRIEFSLIYGGLAILLLAAARVLPVTELAPDCVFRTLTGVPCPACGSTRCIALLSHGRILAALSMNPLTAALWITALLAFVYRCATLVLDVPRVVPGFSEHERTALRFSAVAAVLANWFYLVLSML